MKTLVFWVIQNDNHMTWVPENLSMCFWTFFKLFKFKFIAGYKYNTTMKKHIPRTNQNAVESWSLGVNYILDSLNINTHKS